MARPAGSAHHELSMAGEDYLEAIYCITEIEGGSDGIRSVDVAERLGVSKASVNKALTSLKESGMVEQNRYGRVTLTDRGKEYGAQVWRTHRALRLFLSSVLGVDDETADDEACLMEHALCQDTIERLIGFLGTQGVSIDD